MADNVHPLDDARLDACVDAAMEDPESAVSAGLFEISNKQNANRAVWKIGRVRAELADAEALYSSERAVLDGWIADQRLRAERAVEFLTTLTAGYHAIVLAEDAKKKTIRLPAGDLVARKQPDRWVLDDEQLLPWAIEHCPDVVRQRDPEVDRAAVKRTFNVAGGMAIALGGEVVPGVAVVDGEIKYSVKPRVVEQ